MATRVPVRISYDIVLMREPLLRGAQQIHLSHQVGPTGFRAPTFRQWITNIHYYQRLPLRNGLFEPVDRGILVTADEMILDHAHRYAVRVGYALKLPDELLRPAAVTRSFEH